MRQLARQQRLNRILPLSRNTSFKKLLPRCRGGSARLHIGCVSRRCRRRLGQRVNLCPAPSRREAPEDWRSPRRCAHFEMRRQTRQRLGLRWPAPLFPIRLFALFAYFVVQTAIADVRQNQFCPKKTVFDGFTPAGRLSMVKTRPSISSGNASAFTGRLATITGRLRTAVG